MQRRIIYLPGLGADKEMFSSMQEYLPGITPEWPTPSQNDDLHLFARRCQDSWNIKPEDILVGFSFGAMVAKEIRNFSPSEKSLILISSCKNKHALDFKFIQRSSYLEYIPDFILHFLLIYVGPYFTARDISEKKYIPQLKTMAKKSSLQFFRWATKACSSWNSESRDFSHLQIHGKHDTVIPYPQRDPHIIIEDGSHLITYTHAKEVTNLIKEYIGE